MPSSLVLLTVSIDIPEIKKLGAKAIVMFLTGTFGIIFGGPISIIIIAFIAPNIIHGAGIEEVSSEWTDYSCRKLDWRRGKFVAAMKEVFNVEDAIFSSMIAVDVIVANLWMAVLLYGAGNNNKVDKWFNADSSSIKA